MAARSAYGIRQLAHAGLPLHIYAGACRRRRAAAAPPPRAGEAALTGRVRSLPGDSILVADLSDLEQPVTDQAADVPRRLYGSIGTWGGRQRRREATGERPASGQVSFSWRHAGDLLTDDREFAREATSGCCGSTNVPSTPSC